MNHSVEPSVSTLAAVTKPHERPDSAGNIYQLPFTLISLHKCVNDVPLLPVAHDSSLWWEKNERGN